MPSPGYRPPPIVADWGAWEEAEALKSTKERPPVSATPAHCKTCDQERSFSHFHDLAHGIPGTHMAGSERFTCDVCGESIRVGDNDGQFRFMFDQLEPL